MSDNPTFEDYRAKYAAIAAPEAQILPENKAALLDALAAAGIARVVVGFDGSGDEGQIESVTAISSSHEEVELPTAHVAMKEVDTRTVGIVCYERRLERCVEVMAYDILTRTHCGWKDGEGGFGEFTFDVETRTMTLDYDERYVACNNYRHEF